MHAQPCQFATGLHYNPISYEIILYPSRPGELFLLILSLIIVVTSPRGVGRVPHCCPIRNTKSSLLSAQRALYYTTTTTILYYTALLTLHRKSPTTTLSVSLSILRQSILVDYPF